MRQPRPGAPSPRSELLDPGRARGHDEATIRRVVHDNPLAFFAQCRRFRFTPRPEAEPATVH